MKAIVLIVPFNRLKQQRRMVVAAAFNHSGHPNSIEQITLQS